MIKKTLKFVISCMIAIPIVYFLLRLQYPNEPVNLIALIVIEGIICIVMIASAILDHKHITGVHMKKIATNFKQMTLFQKIQVLSGVIPVYSCIFVLVASYIINCKRKKWLLFSAISVVYFSALCITSFLNIHFAVKYMIWCPISIIGNYLLVSLIQMKKT